MQTLRVRGWNYPSILTSKIDANSVCDGDCYYPNDRRSRRLFLYIYSAIFQLTSAKFQTFVYNSRAVRSSFKEQRSLKLIRWIKFGVQFEINKMFVFTKIRGNVFRDFRFMARKPP